MNTLLQEKTTSDDDFIKSLCSSLIRILISNFLSWKTLTVFVFDTNIIVWQILVHNLFIVCI